MIKSLPFRFCFAFILFAISCFFAPTASALTYYSSGSIISNNLLSSVGTSSINAFGYNLSDLSVGTTAQVQFSQNALVWYSSAGVLDAWDTLEIGDNTAEADGINLSALNWSGDNFYYKLQFSTTDTSVTAVLDEVAVIYTPGASVHTLSVSNVDATTAIFNANITTISQGNATVRGFEYGLTQTGTWAVSETGDFTTGEYSLDVLSLNPNTTYYVRAYATNPASTGYGEWVSFTTGAYASAGNLISNNLLSGQSIATITGFEYTLSAKPANTTATVQFSQNGTTWYNLFLETDGEDSLELGTKTIPLCNLKWTTPNFYYKINFDSSLTSETPILDSVNVTFDDSTNTCSPIVLKMDFDEGTGQVTYDKSITTESAQNNGQLGSTSGADSSDPLWTNDGKFGKALLFDGTNDYVELSHNVANIQTVSIWVNLTSNTEPIISFDGGTHDISVAGGVISATGFSSPTIYVNGIETASITTGEWANITVTTDTAFNGTNVKIGNVGTDYLQGSIDQLAIYGAVLSMDEIRQVYNQGADVVMGALSTESDGTTPSNSAARAYCVPGDTTFCNPPVAEWNFEEGTGISVNDTSGNANIGTWNGTGATHWTQGKIGKAGKFNGTDDYVDVGTGPSTIRTISFWVYPETTTEYFINTTSTTDYLASLSGTLDYTGDASETIYVNGIQTSAIVANSWQHIEVVLSANDNGSNFDIGRTQDTNYLQGKIDQVRIYNYARTPAQIAWDYNKGAPVAHYQFDECEGTTSYDASGNGNNGTITIGATGTQTSAGNCESGESTDAWYNGASGKWNSSMSFDGVDDYASIPDSSQIDLTNKFAISAWVNPGNISSTKDVLSKKADSTLDGYRVRLLNGGSLRFEFSDGTSHISIDAPAFFEAGVWVHFAVIHDGSNIKIYKNGNLVKDQAESRSAVVNVRALHVGAYTNLSAYWFNGLIDDVRIYNYALTAEQVKTLYNNDSAIRFE